ncbi:MAG: family 16 glycosylhydrolase [Melioribacteraceae bacterium]|nr:family 16 glycosylhydrolase [Melioribacteraceae bacterium]MCF8356650.1 family 16 glycosylhydrolase [Melioribacteraceae bacterium]MCF8393875.1 family 16 glycosylhydrolase [Melioribacteraceae bacterium]
MYLKPVVAALYLILTISLSAQTYTLVWSDEFSGTQLNESIWTRETGGGGWGNNEWQYYTDRDTNAFVQDGKLTIRALEESFGGRDYTSARLITKDNKSFQYGKIEARMKLPYGQGIWPAFWMLGQNISSVGWPACGEIDIMEMIGGSTNDNVTYGTAHWDDNGHAMYGGNYVLSTGIFADDFHLFTIEWTPQYIKWFVDGTQFHVIDITPGGLSEFHQEFFIILNIAVGGNWPGYPDATTEFPQTMEIDYVRVYQDASLIPGIVLTDPVDNASYDEFADITISAEVEYDGEIEKVEFYQDQMQIGETDLEPFEMTWRNVSAGNYKIKAVAVSVDGYRGESFTSDVIVGGGSERAPYSGNPAQIPGVIEAENYDIGGNGVAYNDNTIPNSGFTYRKLEGVDTEVCLDDNNGFNVGWTEAGEWILYTVNVLSGAEYEISARVASENANSGFHIEIDGVDVTGSITVPNTGDWQEWVPVSSNVTLSQGLHDFKFVVENGGFNINRFEIYEPDTNPQINIIHPNGGEMMDIGTVQEIQWTSLKVDAVTIGLSTNGGSSWTFVTPETPAEFGFYRWLVPDQQSEDCKIMIVDSDFSSINDMSDSVFTIDYVNPVNNKNEIISEYQLYQNYPNPFNPETIISFSLPVRSQVTLEVFNHLGEKLIELVNGSLNGGSYEAKFNARDLPSDVYFCRLTASGFSKTIKMILLK